MNTCATTSRFRTSVCDIVGGSIVGTSLFFAPQAFAYNNDSVVRSGPFLSLLQGNASTARTLLDEWVEDTSFHSSPSIILASAIYHRVQQMRGDLIVGDLLAMIDTAPYHAVLALSDNVKPLPLNSSTHNDLDELTEEWKRWGRGRDEGCEGTGENFPEFETYDMEQN